MEISYHWHNMDTSEAVKNYAAKKIEKLSAQFNSLISAIVRFRAEKINHFVEFTLIGDGVQFIATEENTDLYAAIDLLEKKIERQVRRHKEKHLRKNFRETTREKT